MKGPNLTVVIPAKAGISQLYEWANINLIPSPPATLPVGEGEKKDEYYYSPLPWGDGLGVRGTNKN